jgi:catechol 2,3-dioxygenase-like lactoylglutathione lyase family enzyme
MNLNHITALSLDLKKTIPFYQKLGLELIVEYCRIIHGLFVWTGTPLFQFI